MSVPVLSTSLRGTVHPQQVPLRAARPLNLLCCNNTLVFLLCIESEPAAGPACLLRTAQNDATAG